MKRLLGLIFFLIFISSPAFSSALDLLIPQSDKLYSDLFDMAKAGLIKSEKPEYFKQNALTKSEAASYIEEALVNSAPSASSVTSQAYSQYTEILKAYADKYADEISKISKNKSNANEPDNLRSNADQMLSEMKEIEDEYKHTVFNDQPPVKISGLICARWGDIESFGLSHVRYAGPNTFLQMSIDGVPVDNVEYNLNFSLESPTNDPSYGTDGLSFYGVQRLMDVYTLSLTIYNWKVMAGFFWDNITSFIAAQAQTLRPEFFDRDIYASEEKTKDHFEGLIHNYSIHLDERWSMNSWMGVDVTNSNFYNLGQLKLIAGKEAYFDQSYAGINFLYELAGQLTHRQNLPGFYDTDWSFNFYDASTDKSEIVAEGPLAYGGVGYSSFGPNNYITDDNIEGISMKSNIMWMFKTTAELEFSNYNGKTTNIPSEYNQSNIDAMPYEQQGTAFFVNTYPDLKLKNVELAIKYTRIDPNYEAPVSAINDTSYQWVDQKNKVEMKNITSADDPSALYNNENKIEATAKVNIPYGMFVLNYGVSSQLQDTGNMFYAKHFILGDRMNDEIYWYLFQSNYGYDVAPGDFPNEYLPYENYNKNRYGYDSTLSTNSHSEPYSIINLGRGGLSTAIANSNREYMVSGAVNGDTDKFYDDLVIDFRYELNKLFKYNRDVLLFFYGELTTLNNNADFAVDYDPSRLLCQNVISSCISYNIINSINLLGFVGLERWASNNVEWWSSASQTTPNYGLDYFDKAYGVGFDYDFGSRASVYFRIKEFWHTDSEVSANNFNGWQVFAELKDYF